MAPPTVHDDVSESEIDVPEEFLCPLTLEIMNDPVVSKDGKNFDRRAILKWLGKGNDTCPLTRQPLRPSSLVPNHKLKMDIHKWKIDQGLSTDNDENETKDYNSSPMRHPNSLMSLACVMEFASERVQSISTQREEGQQGELADLLALYEEVLDITDDNTSAALAVSPLVDADQSELSELEAQVDEELKEIKDLYEEVYFSSNATSAQ
ncbi:MAG: hypothetical protein SGILL_008323 [Bacillariaceae sp.]